MKGLNGKPVMLENAQADQGDASLMTRVAARDHAAFAQIVRSESNGLYRIAYRMLNDTAGAEDCAQEALLRLWNNAVQWRGDGPGVGAWLRRVVTNLCLDQLRRRKFASDEDVPERVDPAPLADEALEQERVRAGVVRALGLLNERQRAAIVLTYYEAMANAAAADVLEMNVKAFESLLLRARQALKAALSAQGSVDADDVRGLS